jgi:replicative DNA helicase
MKLEQVKDTDFSILGKLPPQNIEAEEALLGAVLLENEVVTEVVEVLPTPYPFYKDAHKILYDVVLDLYEKGTQIDIVVVTNELKKKGKLDFVGGAYYITQLTNKINSTVNSVKYATIILENHIKRELIAAGNEMCQYGYKESSDVFALLDKSQNDLIEITDLLERQSYTSTKDLILTSIDKSTEASKNKSGITGVPSGYLTLDRITGGFQDTDLIIIAARPSMGKTALALNLFKNATVDFNRPVAVFSLEMSSLQLIQRLQADVCGIDADRIRRGMLDGDESGRLIEGSSELRDKEENLIIDDTPGLSLMELKAKCKKYKKKNKIEMVIVDYLQLMNGGGKDRNEQIGTISRGLKAMAKELHLPVIVLSQLSRAVETRGGDKRPQLSDLRDSGSIEQDADLVMFLYRPDYYGITQDENGRDLRGACEIGIAKHRHGRLGKLMMNFDGGKQRFTEWSDTDLYQIAKREIDYKTFKEVPF